LKQKSRWVRALQYAAFENVPANRLEKFIQARGGLAGCARWSARVDRKQRRPEGDWDLLTGQKAEKGVGQPPNTAPGFTMDDLGLSL
jgi:hypothetical protein